MHISFCLFFFSVMLHLIAQKREQTERKFEFKWIIICFSLSGLAIDFGHSAEVNTEPVMTI